MEQSGIIQPYSQEWWEKRNGCFTASEIWKLMQKGKTKDKPFSDRGETYILEKVHEKLTGKPKMGVNNYATEWGVEHEPLAKKWYGKLTGFQLTEPSLFFHGTIEGFSCTPDVMANEDGLAEIKCPANGSNHLKQCFITNDKYFKQEHPEYYWQCMAQMNITGREWCDFISFDPRINTDLGFFSYRLMYNINEAIEMEEKIEKAREMFTDYVRLFSTVAA